MITREFKKDKLNVKIMDSRLAMGEVAAADAAAYIKKYTEKFGTETLNQFGASAYDCVYAIFNAMKAAIDAGEKIDVTISASDLCEILKKQFTGDFSYDGVTGTGAITWEDNGYVSKEAVKYTLKAANSATTDEK